MHKQDWHSQVSNSRKVCTYYSVKSCFGYEKYLDVLNIRKFRFVYVSFRTSSHDLEIEKGRYNDIPRDRRLCKVCQIECIEDEYHFLLVCDFYDVLRSQYIPQKYIINPNVNKFRILMSSSNVAIVKCVSTYLYYASNKRKV